ncbi:helix-turn-helix transcriptional regulator [Streptomyces sp. MJP52]|uniref:helix-turn-helix domain-containing protein n=1 Tax=Streptomyces sp. MJP52 TaxID=2940555 RepID=UPI0024768521|nr:helix-turn-helix transcriptional regulator [Streptomyces sp. MJP52]MDH6226250.1 hypothetical protein [Streptomyces sp. MJP52]
MECSLPTPFNEVNTPSREVNVSTPETPTMYALVSAERLKVLMERTGTGEPITSRGLAEVAGIAHGTVGALMAGTQRIVPETKARSIAAALGVDLLVLWIPMERAGRAFIPREAAA